MSDFPFVDWLAREYKRRAECSRKWTDYVKAHGLANFCVVKDSTEDRRKLVYNIEESWYKGRHPLSYNEHQQLIKDHKSLLKSYRDVTSSDYERLEVQVNDIDRNDILSLENLSLAESFTNQAFVTSEKCSNGLKELSASVMQSSVEILQQIGSKAPCKFAAIGLGSLAKGEATPYSDLEYAFIVEHSDEYFEKLAVDSYFRIGNLGETPSRYFDIAELASVASEDRTPIIAEEISAGYRIDGLMQKAGNIPTGNGRADGKVLTLTVDGFIELYKSEAVSTFDKSKPGDLSDLLSSSVVIYTNEGDISQLYQEFSSKREAFESYKKENAININQKRFLTFVMDMNVGAFTPDFIKFQPPKNNSIKLKQDIFRYPTLLANNIKMLLGLNNRYSWEVFTHLHGQGVLSKENYRSIQIVLGLAIYIRTREYLHNKAQIDHFSVIPTAEKTSDTSVQGAVFVLFGCLFDSIKQTVLSNVKRQSVDTTNIRELINSIFQNLNIVKDSWQIAEVCYFAGQYNMAKHKLCKGLGPFFEDSSCEYVLHTLRQMSNSKKEAEKYLELCCYILYHTKRYGPADSYFQWLIQNRTKKKTNTDVRLWTLLRAHCKKEQFQYQEARELVDEVKGSNDDLQEIGTDHYDVCVSYINIAIVYDSLSEYSTASIYLNKALEINKAIHREKENVQRALIYNQMAISYGRLSDYLQSLKYCVKSLSMNKRIFGEHARTPEIAHCYNTLGVAYNFLGKYDSSLEYHKRSLAMRKAIYGETTDHPETAHSYNNIGHTYNYLADSPSSLENLKLGLQMRKNIYGAETMHPHIAKSYNNIGNTYSLMEEYSTALEYHTKALDMRLAVYGETTNNSHIGDSYDYIGRQHYQLGNHAKALEYHTKSLNMRKIIYSDKPNHARTAICHSFIGKECWSLGNYSKSLQHLNETLIMRQATHGATAIHPHLAYSYNDIGNVHNSLGNYSLSLEYHTKALDLRKAIHGVTSNHPAIATCYDYIGRANTGLGNYSTALESLNKSLEMRKSRFSDTSNQPSFAHSYNNIGDVHYLLENHTLSLDNYHKSLEILQTKFAHIANHPYIADRYNKIGNVHRRLGHYTDSIEYLEKSLVMRKAIYGSDTNHPDIATSYNNIGCLYSDRGDYASALVYHTKALNMRQKVYHDTADHPELAQSFQNVAEASKMLKQ